MAHWRDSARNVRFWFIDFRATFPLLIFLFHIGQAVEGKSNAELVVKLAKRYQVAVPICEAIGQLFQGSLTTQQAIEKFFVYL